MEVWDKFLKWCCLDGALIEWLKDDSQSEDELKASVQNLSWFLSIRHWPNKGIVMHFHGFILKKSSNDLIWTRATFELIPGRHERNVKIIFVWT